MVGLRVRKKLKSKMPNSTRSEIVEKILAFIKEYPAYGPARISNELGYIVCPATVYNILKRRGLNRKLDRLLALEDIPALSKAKPSYDQENGRGKNQHHSHRFPGYLVGVYNIAGGWTGRDSIPLTALPMSLALYLPLVKKYRG